MLNKTLLVNRIQKLALVSCAAHLHWQGLGTDPCGREERIGRGNPPPPPTVTGG